MLNAISWLKMSLTSKKILTAILPDIETKKILDPYSTLIRLAVLYFKSEGTKLSILDNKISYNEASFIQGTLRWGYGDNRNDLHNLHDPIRTLSGWYIESKNEDVMYIIKLAIKGLHKLKIAYQSNVNSSLVYHTLDHYINILKKSLIFVKNSELETQDNNKLDESNIIKNTEIENIKNKINTSFKNMWIDNELTIYRDILNVAYDLKKEGKEYEHNINAINKLLDGKDNQIINLLNKL